MGERRLLRKRKFIILPSKLHSGCFLPSNFPYRQNLPLFCCAPHGVSVNLTAAFSDIVLSRSPPKQNRCQASVKPVIYLVLAFVTFSGPARSTARPSLLIGNTRKTVSQPTPAKSAKTLRFALFHRRPFTPVPAPRFAGGMRRFSRFPDAAALPPTQISPCNLLRSVLQSALRFMKTKEVRNVAQYSVRYQTREGQRKEEPSQPYREIQGEDRDQKV